jgi:general secretion pathway protein A
MRCHMEYYQYFRLKGPPFQPASPDSAVYFSPTHLQGLATLEAGLTKDLSGLTMLTGEAGTGKTTLIYSLLKRDHKRFRVAHIDNPKLSFLEIMRVILTQLNLYSAGTTKLDYLNALDHLLDLRGKEERIAIVVDEAQLLSDDVMEELRLLSNRGQQNERCLQLILVGQPELAERLKKPELRQLNQRISTRGVLRPLNAAEAMLYVECRLSAQGGKSSAIFETRALKRLLRRSDGIPRKINMLCHNAMLAAFHAGERKVSDKTAKKIAAEYHESVGIVKPKSRAQLLVTSALAAAAMLALLIAVGAVLPNKFSNRFLHYRTVNQAAANAREISSVTPPPAPRVESRGVRDAEAATAPHGHAQAAVSPASPSGKSAARPENSSGAAPAPDKAMRASANATIDAAARSDHSAATGIDANPRNQVVVKSGDTLEKIAVRYFGSESGINQLVAANPQLTNINQLTVGQIIHLPTGAALRMVHDQSPASPGNSSHEASHSQ